MDESLKKELFECQKSLIEISTKLKKICDQLEFPENARMECRACKKIIIGECLEFIFDLSNGVYEDYKFKFHVCSIKCFEENYRKIDLYKAYPCSFGDFVRDEIRTFKDQNC
jgi:hypothetical protein